MFVEPWRTLMRHTQLTRIRLLLLTWNESDAMHINSRLAAERALLLYRKLHCRVDSDLVSNAHNITMNRFARGKAHPSNSSDATGGKSIQTPNVHLGSPSDTLM
jgi:hypothetical protein